MSGSPPNPIDRLSSLPDGILLLVLSFLGVKKAAVTSALSKRWKFLWSQLPRLEFMEECMETEEQIRKFVSMVNGTLRIHDGLHLEKLAVYLRFDDGLAPNVDSWVDFVSQNKIEAFSLLLMGSEECDFYKLPGTMYCNPSLMRLSLCGCIMDTKRPIEWQSLTNLEVNNTYLPQHVIENVLSSCQILHTLILDECWGYQRLKVSSRCLRHLQVHDMEEDENEEDENESNESEEDENESNESEEDENGSLLEISAPSVCELDIMFRPEGRILQLRNMKSLVKACVEFSDYVFPDPVECMDTAKEIYETIYHVKDLSLGSNYFKAISESVVHGWNIPISERSSLTINTDSEDEHNITGIIALLESSPILEKFVIKGFGLHGESWDSAAKGDLDCDLLHLKTVQLIEFAYPIFEGEPMLTVARAILKRAPALEEMVVRVRVLETSCDYVKISRALHACPRSSAKAVVRLC